MGAGLRVLGRVTIRRAIATPRDAARLAGAQMDPRRTGLDALVALAALRVFHGGDGRDVAACMIGHRRSPETGRRSRAWRSHVARSAGQRSATVWSTSHQPIAVRVSRTPDASEDRP